MDSIFCKNLLLILAILCPISTLALATDEQVSRAENPLEAVRKQPVKPLEGSKMAAVKTVSRAPTTTNSIMIRTGS
jgi:hypothetical protein